MTLSTKYSPHLTEATLDGAIADLARAVEMETRLRLIGEATASVALAAGKWSRKEILGHLIDSELNNLQRFVRGQIPAHWERGVLRLPGYEQRDWVRVQGYARRPWADLVHTWAALNAQVLHVIRNADPRFLQTPCEIGGAPNTLEAVMVDYVGHQWHHLNQILGA